MNPNVGDQPILPPEPRPPSLPPTCVPNLDNLTAEDGEPVDRIRTEKQYRMLTETLYTSWEGPGGDRPFLALANVGLFPQAKEPPLIPDVMVSLNVSLEGSLAAKENRSYYLWVHGKAPEVVIEIVSDLHGGEDTHKKRDYATIGVTYYVVYDPDNLLGKGPLRALALREGVYEPIAAEWLPAVGLGLKVWEGVYEDKEGIWLRWCDGNGQVIPTGGERAEAERQRAEAERQRAEQEHHRAEAERQRAEQEHQRAKHAEQQAEAERQRADRLAAQLRALGVDPSKLT